MKKYFTTGSSFLLLAATLLFCHAAYADTIQITISNAVQSAAPGATVSFNATLLNTSATTVNLDSLTLDFAGANITAGYDAFNNFVIPASLNSGQSYIGQLFTAIIDPSVTSGTYTGFYDIEGDTGGASFSVGSGSNISVTVKAANTSPVVPEPGSWVLLTTGLAGGLIYMCFGRRDTLVRNNA